MAGFDERVGTMQIWAQREAVDGPERFVGSKVRSTKKIGQSPLSKDPDVPRGTVGYIQDFDWISRQRLEYMYAVDFSGDYGVVIVYPDEITLI